MGSSVERFEIERPLEGDAESRRFRAWDRELGAHVLLCLPDNGIEQSRLVAAHAAACLQQHPAAMRLLASGQSSDGAFFAAFEWIEGPFLRDRLREGPLSLRDTELTAATLADLLDQAHAAGVVHGAVTCSNVILGDEDAARAKLLAFGSALGDAADDALALATLVVACGGSAARRGSARSRGWDRVAELSAPLATFVRASLGEMGDAPSAEAAHTALRAWSQARRTSQTPGKASDPSDKGTALLVATWQAPVEPLCDLALAHQIRTSVHADGTLTASARVELSVAKQVEALASLATAWTRLRPATRAALCCEIEGNPATAESFLRAMKRLSEMDATGDLAIDEVGANALRAIDASHFSFSGSPGELYFRHRARGSQVARRLAIAMAIILSVAILVASVWWLLTGGS